MVEILRILSSLILIIQLAGCVMYIPVSGDRVGGLLKSPPDDLDSLLGKTEGEIRKLLSSERPWEMTESNTKYLVYHQVKQHGLLALIIAGPYGGGGGIGKYVDTKTTCFKFGFNNQGTLISHKIIKVATDSITSPILTEQLDCRLAFWSFEYLRRTCLEYEEKASDGSREAMTRLAYECGETKYLADLALAEKDLELAALLAKEFEDRRVLYELVTGKPMAQVVLNTRDKKQDNIINVASMSPQQLKHLADSGHPEAQLQMYFSGMGDKPLIWLCRAADQGHPEAQYRLGNLYWFGGAELTHNALQAYKWYRLAADGQLYRAKNSAIHLTRTLTTKELVEAEKLLYQWKPGDCETEISSYIKSEK